MSVCSSKTGLIAPAFVALREAISRRCQTGSGMTAKPCDSRLAAIGVVATCRSLPKMIPMPTSRPCDSAHPCAARLCATRCSVPETYFVVRASFVTSAIILCTAVNLSSTDGTCRSHARSGVSSRVASLKTGTTAVSHSRPLSMASRTTSAMAVWKLHVSAISACSNSIGVRAMRSGRTRTCRGELTSSVATPRASLTLAVAENAAAVGLVGMAIQSAPSSAARNLAVSRTLPPPKATTTSSLPVAMPGSSGRTTGTHLRSTGSR